MGLFLSFFFPLCVNATVTMKNQFLAAEFFFFFYNERERDKEKREAKKL